MSDQQQRVLLEAADYNMSTARQEVIAPQTSNISSVYTPSIYSETGLNVSSADGQLLVPLTLAVSRYEQVLLGYVLTSIIAVTAILNTIVVCILSKANMKSAVNVILSALAVSDTLTGLSALPHYIYMYALDRSTDLVPYDWCYVQKVSSGILPTIFHTVSVWLTLTLAVQRYIFLCHPLKAKDLCTIARMVNVTVALCFCSLIVHCMRLFDTSFVKVVVLEKGFELETCSEVLMDWAKQIQQLYYPIYYWIRLIGIHLIPSVSLLVLNLILIHVMRTTNRRRRLLILQNRTNEWRRLRETNQTTLLLVIVVTIFLLVELPLGTVMILGALESQLEVYLVSEDMKSTLSLAFNFLVLLSYPVNFFLYVIMSKKFRSNVSLLMCGVNRSRESSMTLQTSREKSSSMELIKSIFTVMAVPTGKSGRKRRQSSAKSTNSSSSDASTPTSHHQTKSESQQQLTQRSCYRQAPPLIDNQVVTKLQSCDVKSADGDSCKCQCIYCMEQCHKGKNQMSYVSVATYANDELLEQICAASSVRDKERCLSDKESSSVPLGVVHPLE